MQDQNLKLAIGDTWHPRYLPYFAMSMVALMLITNVLNLKFVNVAGLSVIGSQIVYVFSLILADIMTEAYGYRRVRRVLYISLGWLVAYAICLRIVVELPPATDYGTNAEFRTIFLQTPRIVFASIAAFFVTELVNSFVMSRLKVRLTGKFFYARALASTAVAQIVNAITFFGLAFAGVMSVSTIISAGAVSWVIVMLCEALVLPLTKVIAVRLKRAEGVEHFDAKPPSLSSSGAVTAAPEA